MATTTPFNFKMHEWPIGAEGTPEGFADVVFKTQHNDVDIEVAARCIYEEWKCQIFFRCPGDIAPRVVAHPHQMPLLVLPPGHEDVKSLVNQWCGCEQ
jgi:hypothetical protein